MPHDDFWEKLLHTFACISQPHPSPHSRGSNPPDLAGSLPNFHAISRSPEFRKILPDFQNFPTLFSNKWLDRHLIQHSHCEDLSHARLCSETLFFMTSKQRSCHFCLFIVLWLLRKVWDRQNLEAKSLGMITKKCSLRDALKSKNILFQRT